MKISFISPIATKAIVQVKIGVLGYINLYKYSSKETVQLIKDEYVEAIYTEGVFKQTNNLNTHLVWSNEYVAKANIALDESTTVYNLTSAIGVKKPNYYAGMSLLFTVPVASKGIAFVDVDGLGNKKLGESGGSIIAKDIYKDQAIMAIYDGKQFIKQKFASIHHKPIQESLVPVLKKNLKPNINDSSYTGDPAIVTSPNAIDSSDEKIFKKIVTVGEKGAMYKTIAKAMIALVNDYGDDGGGNNYAILLLSSFKMPTNAAVQIPGKKEQDLSWISIFAENNKVVDIGSGYWVINGKKAPIFNFKINSVANLKYLEDGISTFLIHGATTLILGKNFEISLIAPNLNTSKLVLSSGIFYQTGFTPEKTCLIAQYGFKFKTNVGVLMYPFNRMILNDGEITLNQFPKHDESRRGYFGMPVGKDAKISNVVVHCNRTKPDLSASAVFHCSDNAILKNVTSTDRINTIKALISRGGKVILENCNFSSRTKGTADNGHDIFIQGYNKDARIYLKKTTGNLNQRLNKATNKGTIMLG